jgi:hypothetical protein
MARIRPNAAQQRAILAAVDDAATANAEHLIALREANRHVGALFDETPGLADEAKRAFINYLLQELM